MRQPTGITGTGADLRKLGAEDAVKALQGLPKHFHAGINFDELKKFDRWEIIKYVRNIATAAVKDGVELSPDLAKFARHGRSTQQVAAGLKRKAEDVFKRQVALLAGEEVDCSVPKPIASEVRSKVGSHVLMLVTLTPKYPKSHSHASAGAIRFTVFLEAAV